MTEPATHSRRARKAIARVEKALGSELQGEPIEAIVWAQRWIPGLELFLLLGGIGDIVFVVVAKPYYVAATNTRVFMLAAGRLWPSARGRVFESPLDTVRIESLKMRGPLRRQVRLQQLGGSEYRLSVHRMYWKELDRLKSLVGSTASS